MNPEVVQQIYKVYSQNVAYCLRYSNIPNFITMHTWTKTSQDSQKIQEKLQTEGFKDIIPRIVLSANHYEFWADQLLRTK